MSKVQQVYEGVTSSGHYGLFTGGMMAWNIDADGRFSHTDRRSWFNLSDDEKTIVCSNLGFDLVTSA